ncbi:MAG: hypothetical protein ACREA3_08275 [Nitrosotalea sp.]
MTIEKFHSFRTISDLQKYLEGYTNSLKLRNEELSKQIGEKMRSNDSNNTAELQELRQKLEGSTIDPKKKKSTKKKDQRTNFYNFDSISIYDGIGVKGELELYFKAMEKTKSELERTAKIKQAIDDLISKGLKRDMGCVLLLNDELPAEIAFISSVASGKKFGFKAIFNVPCEERYEIKI